MVDEFVNYVDETLKRFDHELQKAKSKKEEEEKMELDIKNLDLETYTCKFELMRLRAELGETIDMLKAQIEQAQDRFEDGGEMDHDWVFRMKHRMAATKKVRRLAKVRIAVLGGEDD